MLRKILSVFLVMIMLAGTAAADDVHLDIQFVIHNGSDESAVTAEGIFREKEIMILSGLFPSFVFSMESDNTGFLGAAGMNISAGAFTMPPVKELLTSFFRSLDPEISEGVFSGDLFDEAGIMSTGTVSLDRLQSAVLEMSGSGSYGVDSVLNDGTADGMIPSAGDTDLSGILIRYSLYDEGNYLTLNGLEGDITFFTLSFDFTDPSVIKTVFGYPENGKNYYSASEIRVISDQEISIRSVMFSDEQKTGYRTAMNNPPVLNENWSIRLSENGNEMEITGEIIPGNGKRPVDITASLSADKKPVFLAKIGFRDWDQSWFTLTVNQNSIPVNTESLKVITPASESEQPETLLFVSELTGNAMKFITKLNQALPDDYSLNLFPLN